MTQERVAWQLMAFAEVPDFNRIGLPESEAGSSLAKFIDNGNGQHITVLMSKESSLMLASCGLELGEITPAMSYFRAFRRGWPEDWENPADPSAWITPTADQ